MFVIYKDRNGLGIRPAYIGFIKNNHLRRAAMIAFSPILIVAAITFGLLLNCISFAFAVVHSFWLPFAGLIPGMKEYWNKPRTDCDE